VASAVRDAPEELPRAQRSRGPRAEPQPPVPAPPPNRNPKVRSRTLAHECAICIASIPARCICRARLVALCMRRRRRGRALPRAVSADLCAAQRVRFAHSYDVGPEAVAFEEWVKANGIETKATLAMIDYEGTLVRRCLLFARDGCFAPAPIADHISHSDVSGCLLRGEGANA
jgi:hypothetical protein